MRISHNITLKCKADALPKPRYLWKFDGKILSKAVQNTLTIRIAQVKDAGSYTCKAENFYGSKEITRMVNVECECINPDNSVINYGILSHSAQAQLKLLFVLSVPIQTKMIACATSSETECNQQQRRQR